MIVSYNAPQNAFYLAELLERPPPPATGFACSGQVLGRALGRFWAGFGLISELFWEVLALWAGFGQVLGIFGSVFHRFQLWA